MKPICVNCKLFFQPERNGVYFEEGMPVDKDEQGNKVWGPYKFWSGDVWKCRGCDTEIIVGVGAQSANISNQIIARWFRDSAQSYVLTIAKETPNEQKTTPTSGSV